MKRTSTPVSPGPRRSRLAGLVALVAAVALAAPALAVTATMGNDPFERGYVDTWNDFTVVDYNNPAPFDGYFTQIDYYAHRGGDLRFVVVDSAATVTWISDLVSVQDAGLATLDLDTPVGVTAGSNLGVYSVGVGVISYDADADAAHARWEIREAGVPSVGDTLNYLAGSQGRVYSMRADIEASSPDICKKGGWEAYGYKNQGQCIASVVANENSGH